MAKLYQTEAGVDETPRFRFSKWWNGFEKAVSPLSPDSFRNEHIDEHAVWMTALLADMGKNGKLGSI